MSEESIAVVFAFRALWQQPAGSITRKLAALLSALDLTLHASAAKHAAKPNRQLLDNLG